MYDRYLYERFTIVTVVFIFGRYRRDSEKKFKSPLYFSSILV